MLDRLTAGQNRFLRLKARQGAELESGGLVSSVKRAGIAQAESGAMALAFGYMAGRAPEKLKVGGIPLELLTGLSAHAVGLIASPEIASHLQALGTGAVDSFFNSFGRGLGRRARKAAGLPPPAESLAGEDVGESDSTGGGALSDEELARLARRI